MKTSLLKSEDYTRSPWKNGGGILTDTWMRIVRV